MYYLKDYLQFETKEEGLKMLAKAKYLRSRLVGSIYSDCVDSDIEEIKEKIYQLESNQHGKINH